LELRRCNVKGLMANKAGRKPARNEGRHAIGPSKKRKKEVEEKETQKGMHGPK